MNCVLAAKTAILLQLNAIGVVFLVLRCVVVALFAFGASESDFYTHYSGSSFILASLLFFSGK
jgi:Na+-transporting methylmalonyl-CoA/oxaloacetate decarboxylase gamma subunit